MRKHHISPVTVFAAVLGVAALLTGVCTLTAHNVALGAMSLALGYVNHREEINENVTV